MRTAALGLRAHSGWAALVAVAGDGTSVEVLERRRIEMTDPRRPLSKQPYHEAEDLPIGKAAALLDGYAKKDALSELIMISGRYRVTVYQMRVFARRGRKCWYGINLSLTD